VWHTVSLIWAPGSQVPWVVAGNLRCGYEIMLYLMLLKYIMWEKCTPFAESKNYPDSRTCGLRHAMWDLND